MSYIFRYALIYLFGNLRPKWGHALWTQVHNNVPEARVKYINYFARTYVAIVCIVWCLAAASWWADCRWRHCCCQAHTTQAVTSKVSPSAPVSHASSSLKTTTSTHSWCLASATLTFVLAYFLSRIATALTAWTLTKGCYLNNSYPEVSPIIV